MTISEFARLVGLAPSALRFYDDCGLLPPAEVDATNGYRYYDASQAQHLLALARNGGTEMSLMLAALRDNSIPIDAPADWKPHPAE